MTKAGIIYLIRNNINNKCYIGLTHRESEKRFEEHCREKRSNRHLSAAINKYGKENFELIEVFSVFDIKDLMDYETEFIKKYNTLVPNGYNLNFGEGNRGFMLESTKRLMSKAKKGKPSNRKNVKLTFETKLKTSRSKNGSDVVSINFITGEAKYYEYAALAKKDGFNTKSIYSVLTGKRKSYKNTVFIKYHDYANQSGSPEIKKSEHAQRIEDEAFLKTIRGNARLTISEEKKKEIYELFETIKSNSKISRIVKISKPSINRLRKEYNSSTRLQPL